VHDRLGDRVQYFPRNQEELEEMANARVPDEFIFCRDANAHRMESRENHRPATRQKPLPPWCPEGLTKTQKRRLQHERREGLSKGENSGQSGRRVKFMQNFDQPLMLPIEVGQAYAGDVTFTRH
jgi:hypothetical protein